MAAERTESHFLLPNRLRGLPPVARKTLSKLLRIDALERISSIAEANSTDAGQYSVRMLEQLDVECPVGEEDLARIPASGPLVIVANHPFGLLEGLVLSAVLGRVRPDYRFLANDALLGVPAICDRIIPVDVLRGKNSPLGNARAFREAARWLKGGGAVAIFPAGEVSNWQWRERKVADPPWKGSAVRLVALTRAQVLPVFFAGSNSLSFQLAGVIHPAIRTARLPAELLGRRGHRVELSIGHTIAPEEVAEAGTQEGQIEYLRLRTYSLAHRAQPEVLPWRAPAGLPGIEERIIREEVASLREQRLDRVGEFEVYAARPRQIPAILTEIGRLREETFRAAGEGTGRPEDLDSFDAYYDHVFVWNTQAQAIAGAYRLALTQPVLRRFGQQGLYTNTLFHLMPRFFEQMGPAAELGRSFVQRAYQRDYAPLYLLWRGIARYLAARPEVRMLFGAVSISNRYSEASRQLIAEFVMRQEPHPLAALVKPRHPFRPSLAGTTELRRLARSTPTFEALSRILRDLQPQHDGVPVLLRQYEKLGGRVLCLNVDQNFSEVLDCLLLVDLNQAHHPLLRRLFRRSP